MPGCCPAPNQHGWSHGQAVAARQQETLSSRWPVLLLVITTLHGYQTSTAFTASSSLVEQLDAATLVFIFFGPASRVPGNCSASAAEACLICSPPVVAGAGHRTAPAPGRPRRPAVSPGRGRDGYRQLSGRPGPRAW